MEETVIIHNGDRYDEFRRIDTRASFTTRFIASTLALGVSDYFLDDFFISSFWYLVLAGFIFTFLNSILKPIVILLMLPFLLLSLGILYPLVNVIIINILDALMGANLTIEGIFNAIFVSFIVAVVNYAVTNIYK